MDKNRITISDIESFHTHTNDEWKEEILIILKTGSKLKIEVDQQSQELYDILNQDKETIQREEVEALINTNQSLTSESERDTNFTEDKETYRVEDIISKEWIANNFSTLEKLFPLFQRAAFSQDDPRTYNQLEDDEKRVIDAIIRQELSEVPKNNTTDDIWEQIAVFEGNNAIAVNTLKDELDNLFGRGVSRRQERQFLRYHFDQELSKETSQTVQISHDIYKKLVIIWLYYKDELFIKTTDGKKSFTWPECAKDSIDGMLYYKDHQEKYGGENRYKFIADNYSQKSKDTYIAIADIKITDLTYSSIQDVISLLSKEGIAPTFSIALSKTLLPQLWTGENRENSNRKEIE